MAKEAPKQNKLKHIILCPVRILKKARQLYMKSIVECAGWYGVGALPNPAVHLNIPHLPKTNTNSIDLSGSRTSGDEGQREQMRNVGINETRLVMQRQRQPIVGYTYNRMRMGYNTEVRKMGKIDEDQPCSFEGDQMDFKTHLLYLYPRRRSSVVNMRPVYNQ